jgi:hypothetical protein
MRKCHVTLESPDAEHGARVFIQDHGAVLGKSLCPTYSGN